MDQPLVISVNDFTGTFLDAQELGYTEGKKWFSLTECEADNLEINVVRTLTNEGDEVLSDVTVIFVYWDENSYCTGFCDCGIDPDPDLPSATESDTDESYLILLGFLPDYCN